MKIETLAVLASRRLGRTNGGDHREKPVGKAPGSGDCELARLEMALAAMERGAEAAVFSSGLAATWAVLQTLRPGEHVIASAHIHGGTRRLMTDLLAPWGLELSFVDTTRPDQVSVALRDETRLVWLESPSGTMLHVTEISRIAATAHRAGALCVVDNTSTTPVLQRPLEHRADVVMHLTTSYLSGNGDSRGGAVVVAENGPFFDQLRRIQAVAGAHLSPFDCLQICQGLPALPLRMRAMCATTERVVAFLWGHPGVESVHYPGLSEHPGHEIGRGQMNGFGGRLVFRVKGGGEMAALVADSTRLVSTTASAGGSASRIEHLAALNILGEEPPEDMLRLSIGLEHADDLMADLDQALPRPE